MLVASVGLLDDAPVSVAELPVPEHAVNAPADRAAAMAIAMILLLFTISPSRMPISRFFPKHAHMMPHEPEVNLEKEWGTLWSGNGMHMKFLVTPRILHEYLTK